MGVGGGTAHTHINKSFSLKIFCVHIPFSLAGLVLARNPMNIQDEYNRWSATYDQDRNLTRDLDQSITRQALAGLRSQFILEIGCGTGKNTVFLAEIGARILALDFSPGMLARARNKALAGNVTFAVADLTRPWPIQGQSADLIACNLVLEHIRDLDFVFAQASRILAPGGRFFVSELHPFWQYLGVQANFQGRQGTVQIPAFVHHLSDFTGAAERQEFALVHLKEYWHPEDQGKPPRLVSMMFERK
jgi:ubiquinone/menaquinone biosynthesis C-methylase UbiE